MHNEDGEHEQYLPKDDEGEQPMAPQSAPPELSGNTMPEPELKMMSIAALIASCMREFKNYRCGDVSDDRYGVELFRRALCQRDSDAWTALQVCFSDTIRGWLHSHPRRDFALRLDSDENYVAQTFARFWQATAHNQKLAFATLATALAYLRMCLNGAILDTLRAYSRPKEIQVWVSDIEEQQAEDGAEQHELWAFLFRMFPKSKERRLLYLLFHCGLKPREIMRHSPQDFADVQEIYQLQRNIMDRLLRNARQIRWLMGDGRESA